MWSWFFRAKLPGDVPLWWAAAAGLYSNKGSTGAAIQSDVKTIIDGSGQFPEQAELRLKSYDLLSEGEILRSGQEAARLLPGAVIQFSALLPRLAHSGYAPIHSTATTLATPFRRAELPPATGLAGLPTLAEMVADFLAGARVPVASAFPPPWRPNPLLGAVVGFLGAGLAQLWGRVNRPPGLVEAPDWNLPDGIEVSYSQAVSIQAESWGQVSVCSWLGGNPGDTAPSSLPCNFNGGEVYTYERSFSEPAVIRITFKNSDTLEQGPQQGGQIGDVGAYMEFHRPDGSSVRAYYASGPGNFVLLPSQWGYRRAWAMGYPTSIRANGIEQDPPLIPGQSPVPGMRPLMVPMAAASAQTPAVTAAAARASAVLAPAVSGEPVTEPGPANQPARPATVPTVAPTPAYVPSVPPTAQPVTRAGTLPLPSPTPTPSTPGTSVVPWPGAKPIDTVPLAPPATIEGIARKTGELEGKLDQIGGMLQPRGGDFDWDDVFDWLARLGQWLLTSDPAGSYGISSPCVATGEGSEEEPLVAGWPATIGGDRQITKRLDALAQLLQHHKTLKQPSCKNPSPTGEVVTVQFEET